MTTRVLLVDDHPLIRTGLSQLLEEEPDLELAGTAGSGEEALALAESTAPDLIVLDLNMEGMSGVETLKALRAAGIPARVVMLTVSDAQEDLVAALRAGADGYLVKDIEPEDLVAALRRAGRGETVIAEHLTPLLAKALSGNPSPTATAVEQLTAQEHTTLRYLGQGLSNKMIARKMGLAEGTVKVHVKAVLRKLHLRSRVEAAIWALEHAIR